MQVELNNITIIGDDVDVPSYSALITVMKNYFSSELKITVKSTSAVEYLILSNDNISPEKLFDEYWNFREKVWFTLPKTLIKSRHLSILQFSIYS